MKKYKIWFFYTLLLSGILTLILNILVDPYGVFDSNLLENKWRPWFNNIRVQKINYLDKHYKEFDSYMIGSSRIGVIKPIKLKIFFPDATFYNLYLPAADTSDNYKTIHYILNNYLVKNILLMINISDMNHYGGAKILESLTFKHHYKVSGENPVDFYFDYLLPKGSMWMRKIEVSIGIIKV